MKNKVAILLLSILMLIPLFSGCTSTTKEDKSLEGIKERGEFIVGLDDSFPPMGFKDEKGEIVGFDIDLAKEVGGRMGVKVVFKPVDWDGVLLSLKNKEIDVIWNGLTITEERKKEIDFSNIYLENRQIIIVKSNSNINNKADLNGKIVGLQLGSSSEIALNTDEKIVNSLKEIKKFSNNTEALMDLNAGRVDAVVIDEVVGRYYMEKKKGLYKVLEENFGKESYGVGFRKEDIKFREEVDKILEEMKKDQSAENISKRWFGENIMPK